MATGMFGNQYQQAVVDEQNLRRQQAQTGGLTGWAAITNAMSGIGSEIGYQGGQAMGGMTPVQAQQANYESIINSVPNFDPTSPESLNEMASAMWNGGEYDRGMEFYTRSQSMTADNLNVELKKLQIENAKAPKDKEMVELADGRMYYKDTLELVKPDLVVPEKPQKDKSAAMLKYERNLKAVEYRNTVLKDRPSESLEDKRILLKEIDDAGYSDTALFTQLQDTITEIANTERLVSKDVQTDAEQSARVQQQQLDDDYARVLDRNSATDIVSTFFLDNNPSGSTNESDKVLASGIGAAIATYDRKLYNARELGRVTPTQAEPYYEKVLRMPEVYVADRKGFGGYIWSKKNFNLVLDTAFGNNNKKVTFENANKYLDNELIIPNVTMFDLPGGAQALDEMTIKFLKDGTWTFDTIFAED